MSLSWGFPQWVNLAGGSCWTTTINTLKCYSSIIYIIVLFLTTVICVDPSRPGACLHPLSVKYITWKAWPAVMWVLYDPLHTNAQNRSRVHILDESYWRRRRHEGKQSSTSPLNPFKYRRDAAPLHCWLKRLSYTEEHQRPTIQCTYLRNMCKQSQDHFFIRPVFTDFRFILQEGVDQYGSWPSCN